MKQVNNDARCPNYASTTWQDSMHEEIQETVRLHEADHMVFGFLKMLSQFPQLLKALVNQTKTVVEVYICSGTTFLGRDVIVFNEVMDQFIA